MTGFEAERAKRLLFTAAAFAAVILWTADCAYAPVRPVRGYTPAIGEKAARVASSMVGRPYRYGGDSPKGFDCSGLVRYSYVAAGLTVPHSTRALRRSTVHVDRRRVRRGDLVFFNEKGGKYSHVGIYLGKQVFVHAPSSGKKVRKDSLRKRYWRRSFVEARRFP